MRSFLRERRDRERARRDSRLWAAGAGGRSGLPAPTTGSGVSQRTGQPPTTVGQSLDSIDPVFAAFPVPASVPGPPSTPAAPTVVAGNPLRIQVVHDLAIEGDAPFTLEADLDHLEVHVGTTSTFTAGPSTLVGTLDGGYVSLFAETSAVGTFDAPGEQRWVRVIAVDLDGLKSGQSAAVAVTATLVDTAFIADAAITNAKIGNAEITNAKIADLSASKITAGTINVSIGLASPVITGGTITGSTLQTASTGQRVVVSNLDEISYYDSLNRLRGKISWTGSTMVFTTAVSTAANLAIIGGNNLTLSDANDNVSVLGLWFNWRPSSPNPTGGLRIGESGSGVEFQSRPAGSTATYNGYAAAFFRNASSEQYKDNIADTPSGALGLLTSLRPREYDPKPDGAAAAKGRPARRRRGFVAEELPDTLRIDDGYDLVEMVALCVQGIQELTDRMDRLER